MKNKTTITILIIAIAFFAVIAAGGGLYLFPADAPESVLSSRGETVLLDGRGLYARDSVSFAAQGRAQDAVTLAVAIPALLISLVQFRRGSGRGSVILAGTAGYMLYSYASYSFIVTFNVFFLIYIALFSLSLFAFILILRELAESDLAEKMAVRFPRKTIGVYFTVIGTLIMLMWLSRIIPALVSNVAPIGLDHYSTLGIQVLDLGIIVPLCFIISVLLFRRRKWGVLLSGVVMMKAFTMLLAIIAMIIIQYVKGVEISPLETAVFLIITAAEFALLIPVIRSIPKS